ncbi:hypothetical protein GOP47_0013989 [Adiantum capillus-veneris]|uniref:Pentatricopeptide repeat-containing protein n=1 Tax=Adiantum capillus-veneris TaxID=13818 RepID=A0A9D4ZDR4_ADICA|nr:hypothetical protein GOP47_0013989 [Adiantum capillus-veneris]
MLPKPSVEELASILQQCRSRSQALTLRLHIYVAKCGLEGASLLGNELVTSLAHWALVKDARWVFDRLLCRKERSWSSLIFAYVNCERPQDALELYHQNGSDIDLAHPSAHAIVAVLKACAKLKNVTVGLEVHSVVDRLNLSDHNIHVGSALLVMYGKCGLIGKAQEVFDKLVKKNVVSWTALITGYAEHGHGEKALEYFEKMQVGGVLPNAVTFICSLKACGCIGAIDKGQELHCEIERRGLLHRDIVVSMALLDMYTKCEFLSMAQQFFERLPSRNVVLWNILITGYTDFGYGKEALGCFKQMQLEGIRPDAVTFVCALKACSILGDIDEGRTVHAEIARHGLLMRDLAVRNSLIDIYAKCGWLTLACQVFDSLSTKDVVSWTTLIAGYADHGLGKEALTCLEQMQLDGFFPNDVSLICCLKACGSIRAAEKGLHLHIEIEKLGLLEENFFVGNIVVDMYARCGLLTVAHRTCEKLQVRNVAAWNALIAGYAERGYGKEALDCLKEMQFKGVSPDNVTYMLSLKACADIHAIGTGWQIHAELERQGLVEWDHMLGNTLINMYAKCGLFAMAQEIYSNLCVHDVVSKTSLLVGYTEYGQSEEILNQIVEQQDSEFIPDAVAILCSLKACGSIGAKVEGQKIHSELERQGMLEKDPTIGNTLINMYAKCGLFAVTQKLFNRFFFHDVVSWTVLIASYVEQMRGEEALTCLEEMQLEGISPSAATFVCSLKACAIIGAELKAQEIFADLERQGLTDTVDIANTVVGTYAKMGLLAKAQDVFDRITERDVVSWNALMTGYAVAGKSEGVLKTFSRMLGEGVDPDLVTLVIVLHACSGKGLLFECLFLFEAMSKDYGLVPGLKHYTCVVCILGRAGLLEKAVAMIMKMPFSLDNVVWNTVWDAVRHWGSEQALFGVEGASAFLMVPTLKS